MSKASRKAEKPITIGSVVELKSGGPRMTVVKAVTGLDCTLTVLWADKENRIAKADIVIQALRLVK